MDEEAFSSTVMEDIAYLKGKGYVSSRFIAMVNSKGALATAKELVARKKPTEGLLRLWELKELKRSIEYRILDERWKSLFTDEERATARKILRKLELDV